jgi:hypothetical protein
MQVLRFRLAQKARQTLLRMTEHYDANFRLGTLERFDNSCALSAIEQGNIFLKKMLFGSRGIGVQRLLNHCSFRVRLLLRGCLLR